MIPPGILLDIPTGIFGSSSKIMHKEGFFIESIEKSLNEFLEDFPTEFLEELQEIFQEIPRRNN